MITDSLACTPSRKAPASLLRCARQASRVVHALGATIDETHIVLEDFWPGYVTSQFLFGGGPTGTISGPRTFCVDGARWSPEEGTGAHSISTSDNTIYFSALRHSW